MSAPLVIPLKTEAAQALRLRDLQRAFADVCNELAPVARETRCWNRVALHHMCYRSLRDKFPQMGSQMVCNAIYSVSRTCRVVYQAPGSPFNLSRWGNRRLPLLQFTPSAPVFFDRHTLSLKAGHLSMFTLDGRMRFELDISAADEQRFHDEKLYEIVLLSAGETFRLAFSFDGAQAANGAENAELPEYVIVLPDTLETQESGVPV